MLFLKDLLIIWRNRENVVYLYIDISKFLFKGMLLYINDF